MKITVSRQELLAAALFVSKDESRHILNGVSIEVRPGKEKPVIVATDGRRLVVIESRAEQQELTETGAKMFHEEHTLLLRADFLKIIADLSKKVGMKNFPWICFDHRERSERLEVTFVGPGVFLAIDKGAIMEGAFPDWRKAIPAANLVREPINEIGVNAEYVADFADAAKIMEATAPNVNMNLVGKGFGGAIEIKLAGVPTFYGLLMQCALLDQPDYQPEFLFMGDLPPPSSRKQSEDEDTDSEENAEEFDAKREELIETAATLIRMENKCGVAWLNGKLKIGYARCSLILDELEKRGIVGPIQEDGSDRDIISEQIGDGAGLSRVAEALQITERSEEEEGVTA